MHLSPQQVRALGEVMRLQATAVDGDTLRLSLGQAMLDLLNGDTYSSLVWNAESGLFERAIGVNASESSLRAWDSYYRHIDPITSKLMAARQPTLSVQVLAEKDLMRTEFYADFLRPSRQHWGVNVYFFHQGASVGDMRIWRSRERGNFDDADLALLRMLEPSLAATLGRLAPARRAVLRPQEECSTDLLLREMASLTAREAEVAVLLSEGAPDKRIAGQLGLSLPTVRFHAGNVFRKLRVSGRASVASRVNALLRAAPNRPN